MLPPESKPHFVDLNLDIEGSVATLTFNRPQTRNALNANMMAEIGMAVRWLEQCEEIRVTVLRGSGGHFCAGGDLNSMRNTPPAPPGEIDPERARYREFGRVLLTLNRLPSAVIALVQGTCVGGGFGMAACADVVIADPTARFGLPEPRHGFIPSQILPFLVRRLGEAPVRRIAVTADVIDAEEARRIGMVDRLVSTDALDVALNTEVSRVLAAAPRAVSAVKTLVLNASDATLERVLDDSVTRLLELLRGAEAQAGIEAFLSKRPPPWRIH
ncbi:MAG: enoyl-CoA hydratase/isomerase family protein [Pseudomonadales bacterium]